MKVMLIAICTCLPRGFSFILRIHSGPTAPLNQEEKGNSDERLKITQL